MKKWRMKKYKNKEAKKSRWIEEMKWEWIKEWRSQELQEAKNPKNPKNHKINFKYFTIFNTSLFYKPFSTTSKSI